MRSASFIFQLDQKTKEAIYSACCEACPNHNESVFTDEILNLTRSNQSEIILSGEATRVVLSHMDARKLLIEQARKQFKLI